MFAVLSLATSAFLMSFSRYFKRANDFQQFILTVQIAFMTYQLTFGNELLYKETRIPDWIKLLIYSYPENLFSKLKFTSVGKEIFN